MGRFETEILTQSKNLEPLTNLPSVWLDRVHHIQKGWPIRYENERTDGYYARQLYAAQVHTPRRARVGLAKDQLILIIICSVAIAVAAVALVYNVLE